VRVARGRWALAGQLEPFGLPEALTAPTPSYVSLYSALHHHGLIEQIPEVIYAVTLGPTRTVSTPIGTVSLHHVVPRFYTGYEVTGPAAIKLATMEKALVDVFYFTPARSRLFTALPEIDWPQRFSVQRARSYLRLIESPRRQAMVARRLAQVLPKRAAL
jgi:predicted transcriptional regulator of viral defense system